jgi:division protein CdvB (Snf7/Vps24/ESCRT-III family)
MSISKRSSGIKEKIITALDLLGKYHNKLSNLKNRLKIREKELFEKTIIAKQTGKEDLALIFANEISNIRKLQNNLDSLLIHLEQLIIRLQTTIELGEFITLVANSRSLINSVQKDVKQISPELASILDDLSKGIEIVNTNYYSPETEFNVASASDEVEQIINEAAKEASKRIKTIAENLSTSKEKLPAKYSEILEAEGYGDVEILVTNKFNKNLEDKLLRYIVENQGKISLKQCAEKFGVAKEDIREALINLSKQGKIQFKSD